MADWIDKACDAGAPGEFRVFAEVLQRDHSAVQASLSLCWNNGQVEGQVNKQKLIKRRRCGRAKFDLLRQPVLHAA